MNFFTAFSGVFSIVLLGGIGFFASKTHLINPDYESFISKFALTITIPLLMFSNGYEYFTKDFVENALGSFFVAFVMILFSYFLGFMAAKLFKVKENEQGICALMFALSNTIFIGLPVCTYYYGSEGVPSVIMYYMANTFIFWTIGTTFVARDGGQKVKLGLPTLKKVFSPQVISFFVGGAFQLTGVRFPSFLSSVIDSVGQMTTPLVTILAGAVLGRIGLKSVFRLNRTSVIALFGRYLVSPAIALAFVCLLPVPPLTGNVFVAQSAMPVMNQSMLIAKYYGANDEVATKTLAASILIMTVLLPMIVLLANKVIR